jgi:putative addiction module killer protein
MVELRQTDVFAGRIDGLTDKQARGRILARIERLAMGNPGDVAPVGDAAFGAADSPCAGLSRLLHAKRQGSRILLAGGDKSTQGKDIKLAILLAKNL